jgi:hypothetical protein
MVDIFDPACELLPPWTKEIYLCTVAPLQYLLSYLLPPPPFSKKMYSIPYTHSGVAGVGWGGGEGGLKSSFVHALT